MGYLEVVDEADLPHAREHLIRQTREAAGDLEADFQYHMMYVPEEEHFEMAVAIELNSNGRGGHRKPTR